MSDLLLCCFWRHPFPEMCGSSSGESWSHAQRSIKTCRNTIFRINAVSGKLMICLRCGDGGGVWLSHWTKTCHSYFDISMWRSKFLSEARLIRKQEFARVLCNIRQNCIRTSEKSSSLKTKIKHYISWNFTQKVEGHCRKVWYLAGRKITSKCR